MAGVLRINPCDCGVRKEYFSTLDFKYKRQKGEKMETCQAEDLKKYHGVDPRGEYDCPHCGGVLYCVEETKAGDAIYQCQKCFGELKVVQ